MKLREHACPYCPGVAYQTKSVLTRHIETVHEKRRDHACPYCPGVAFGEKGHLKTHIETVHEKRRDHVCGYCKGVAFGRASNLKAHIRPHRQQRARSARRSASTRGRRTTCSSWAGRSRRAAGRNAPHTHIHTHAQRERGGKTGSDRVRIKLCSM